MEEARQHTFVDSGWFSGALTASILATLALAPIALVGLFFGDVFFDISAAFCAAVFLRLALSLTWSWHKREIREWGARICSHDTNPTGFWAVMMFGLVAGGIALFGLYVSIMSL